ncbi:hypothetical protein HanIR_Chr01g0033411 [Helianthus annuus]|nr:hypothetical protein HanIR_Chr01g0033411 [Helianthus annuus]
MLPPTNAPKVTAGLTCPPEIFAPTDTATNNPKAWASAAATSPAGLFAAPSVSLVKAIPEPWPANTKISVLMNSAANALMAPGCCTSSWYRPTAIRSTKCLGIGFQENGLKKS